MAGVFAFGGNLYDINDMKVARNNNDGTYGTLVDVPSVDMCRIELVMKSAQARGDGGISALASSIESANVTMRNVGLSRDHWEALYPVDNYLTGSTPSQIERMFVKAGKANPYFGVIARIFDGESADSGVLLFIPRVKIMQNVQWQVEYNTFVTPEMTGMAVSETSLLDPAGDPLFVYPVFYESALPQITVMPLPTS